MKIAGQKNPGAWFRFNKFLKNVRASAGTGPGVGAFQSIITGLDTFLPFVGALNALAQKAGVSGTTPLYTTAGLANAYATNGIPLEVWMGKLSFDTYTKIVPGAPDKPYYQADSSDAVAKFANDLRHAAILFKTAYRQSIDLHDTATRADGNPGGLPDANKNT